MSSLRMILALLTLMGELFLSSRPTAGAVPSGPDRGELAVRSEIVLDRYAPGIAVGSESLWILQPKMLLRVDMDTGETKAQIPLECTSRLLTFSAERVFAACQSNRVFVIDPSTDEVTFAPVDLGDGVIRIVAGPDFRWIVNGGDRSLTRIERGSHSTTMIPLPASSRPVSVLAGDGSLWLATIDDYRGLGMQQARLDEASSGAKTGSPASPQCMSGPDYTKEMLGKECDSAQAIHKSPPGRLAAVAEAGDHGWVFAGSANSPTPALFLLRTDLAGRVSWIRRFGQSPETRGVDVVSLHGGDHVVAADIRHDKESSWETLLARIKADGDLIWEKRFPASGASRLVSQIATLPGGEVVMAGSLMSDAPSQYRQGFIAAIDSGGEVVWEAHLDEVEGIDRLAVSDSGLAAPSLRFLLQFHLSHHLI